MHHQQQMPGLVVSRVRYGPREMPWDLSCLLYRGGAAANKLNYQPLLADGVFGLVLPERLDLVERLYEIIEGDLQAGGSRYTAKARFNALRLLYSWADANGRSPTLSTVAKDFIDWSEYLLYRHQVMKDISMRTAYNQAGRVAPLLDEIFGFNSGLLKRTCLCHPRMRRSFGTQADKQNLNDMFAFGHALLDFADSLSLEAIRGELPIVIRLRNGKSLEDWSGLIPTHKIKSFASSQPRRRLAVRKIRSAYIGDTSWRTRHSLMNLRIEVELLIFISQTGMNLAQAHKLRIGKFRYQSCLDGYQVRRLYKGRRQGEVEFEIYREYRPLFERYLAWRKAILPGHEGGRLFPFLFHNPRSEDVAPNFWSVKHRFAKLEVPYFGPRALRKTRINWLQRRSRDSELTAAMAQHTQETLLHVYAQPNHQIAAAEISRFHALMDPAKAIPGPGVCADVRPTLSRGAPQTAPRPDCTSPDGCIFCTQQRDIDSLDHIWSLVSYRYLKSLELSRYRHIGKGAGSLPAEAVVDRITAKLQYFAASSHARAAWLREAMERIQESYFHPKWDIFIQLFELRV